ncbi:CRISPR-associated endonuclease Cas2 [Alkalimarinus sediminis]|uniref:CRISPR-associated endoribonuclease Cas2 n=1 Tax=Alkalimarinus sediminis TaxID=1632866 RepID=A0A9E8HVL8_9ALTE|nr:CRISPR-associated endonuclease Cas2 [Alkalimarinus sediminis]UZW76604.1 CRISPR-associated endonuclease Cas2 [Alkalimarinus sediminis]
MKKSRKGRRAVIAYDISLNRKRAKVHQILKDWRIDGQKSVAECFLTQKQADELCAQLLEHIDEKTDRLALVWLDAESSICVYGKSASKKSRSLSGYFH